MVNPVRCIFTATFWGSYQSLETLYFFSFHFFPFKPNSLEKHCESGLWFPMVLLFFLLWEMIHFDAHVFQTGWFNHCLEILGVLPRTLDRHV